MMSPIELQYDVNYTDLRSTFFREILPKIIDALDENVDPKWGKMSGQHMVEHLIYSCRMSTGKFNVECATPEEKRTKLQSFLDSNRPISKGFINPLTGGQLVDLKYQHLDEAKDKLQNDVRYYLEY